MTQPPMWISADAQALQIPFLNQSYHDMTNSVVAAIRSMGDSSSAKSIAALNVNTRLQAWYASQNANQPNPIQSLANAAINYLGDTLSTGIYMIIPVPTFGGFPAIMRSLSYALTDTSDPNRPQFTDLESVAGVLLFAAGGKLQTLVALSALVVMMGGDSSQINSAIADLMVNSNPLSDLADAAVQISYSQSAANKITPQSLSSDDQALMDWWNNSTVGKIANFGAGAYGAVSNASADAASFPASLFNAANAAINPVPAVPPPTTPPAAQDPLGSALGSLAAGSADSLIGTWKAITVGTAINTLVPGAASIAKDAAQVINQIGIGVAGGSNMVNKAMAGTAGSVAANNADANSAVTALSDIVGSHLNEIAKLSVSALVIPQATGGIHQLAWSLSQGLSPNAVNAPMVSEDESCFCVFIASNASDATLLTKTIQQVGQMFGIPLLANWGK